jgi:Tfp pilus assembly protein FimT
MVVIGVFGLLIAMTAPSFSRYFRSNQLATTAERFASDLKLARSLAVANGRVYRLNATVAGYTISEPISGRIVRSQAFQGDLNLAAPVTVNFFPWGMAEVANLNLSNSVGNRTINILPTGMVEVQ